ncbi:hypothetical protein GW17_00019892 [Ensete ventricosum]|nr:hypothetical protein GW17_00019892 [Ensete ventricosum]
MEPFPAQPDLSLRISPSNSTPASGWRRPDEKMELGFWRRSLDSTNNSNNKSSTIPCTAKADDTTFELSLGIPSATVSSDTRDSLLLRSLYPHHHHHHFHFHHHHPLPQEGYHPELSLLKPIRGIPIYQNPPSTFRLVPPHQPQHMYDSSSTSNFTPFATTQGMSRSRYSPSRFPAKRIMRSPRMRWTTTLHARFVHAVELLGGHETRKAVPLAYLVNLPQEVCNRLRRKLAGTATPAPPLPPSPPRRSSFPATKSLSLGQAKQSSLSHFVALFRDMWRRFTRRLNTDGFASMVFAMTIVVNLFVRMVEKDLVAWSTMVFGYVQQGVTERALEMVIRLRRMDTTDSITVVSAFSACADYGSLRPAVCMRQDYGFQPKMDHRYGCVIALRTMRSTGASLDQARDFTRKCH